MSTQKYNKAAQLADCLDSAIADRDTKRANAERARKAAETKEQNKAKAEAEAKLRDEASTAALRAYERVMNGLPAEDHGSCVDAQELEDCRTARQELQSQLDSALKLIQALEQTDPVADAGITIADNQMVVDDSYREDWIDPATHGSCVPANEHRDCVPKSAHDREVDGLNRTIESLKQGIWDQQVQLDAKNRSLPKRVLNVLAPDANTPTA